MDSTDSSDAFLIGMYEAFCVLPQNPDFVASEEMLLSKDVPDFLPPSTPLDLEYLYKLILETPSDAGSAQLIVPSSPPPQVAAPAEDMTTICAVCSGQTSLPPSMPPPPAPALPPPGWHRIPQEAYDYGRKQRNYTPSETVYFGVSGCPGVNMGKALRKKFMGLDGWDDAVLRDANSVISCRLSFPGYPPNGSNQISTKRWNKERDQITRGELAYQVARKLKQYLDSMAQGPHGTAPWKIGEGFMHLDNMFLARIESVSKGSWQPEIWVVDPTV